MPVYKENKQFVNLNFFNDFEDTVNRSTELALFAQQIHCFSYIFMRYFLTFRPNGVFEIRIAYKALYFIVTLAVTTVVAFALPFKDVKSYVLYFIITLESLSFLLLILFGSRYRNQQDKIQIQTVWLFWIAITIPTVLSNLFYEDHFYSGYYNSNEPWFSETNPVVPVPAVATFLFSPMVSSIS